MHRRHVLVGALLAHLALAPSMAQTPRLVADVNPASVPEPDSRPEQFVEAGGDTFFVATTLEHGTELWKTDGTAAGTMLVVDLMLGPTGSNPDNLTALGNLLIFSTAPDTRSVKLWRSDGTTAGTVEIFDFSQGSSVQLPREFVAMGSHVFFAGTDPAAGLQLWRTDGTAMGTVRVLNGPPTATPGAPHELTVVDDILFFAATTVSEGTELWRSDGTAAQTFVIDIVPGSAASDPDALAATGGELYFRAVDTLWKSDGTPSGTVNVAAVDLSRSPPSFTRLGSLVVFAGYDPVAGRDLWKTDGTAAGTQRIANMPFNGAPSHLTVLGGSLLFAADTTALGAELWITDGTGAGTRLLADLRPGPLSSQPDQLTSFGGSIYFVAHDEAVGRELWKTDGTPAGTVVVADLAPGTIGPGPFPQSSDPLHLTAGSKLLLCSAAEDSVGRELAASDGTTGGSGFIANVGSTAGWTLPSNPRELFDARGITYFTADHPTYGSELWRTDGTPTGTALVRDLEPRGSSAPSHFALMDNIVYFVAAESSVGIELWRTDGTFAGTHLVYDISLSGGSTPNLLTPARSQLFMTAAAEFLGDELWVSDGTQTGTKLVKDIHLGASGSQIDEMVALGDLVVFTADNGIHGEELWRSDGTEAGTFMLADLEPGSRSSGPAQLTRLGDAVYFAASSPSGGGLWCTDGRAAGTRSIHASRPRDLTRVGTQLYFWTPSSPYELWATDGTSAGTRPIATIGSGPAEMTAVGDRLFFTCFDAAGVELWRSDGTPAGTGRVADINPGPASSSPTSLTASGTRHVWFKAFSPIDGDELWRSDGTAVGTVMVADLKAGAEGSDPAFMTLAGGMLFYAADNGRFGRELWAVDPGASSKSTGEGCATQPAAWLSASDPVLGGVMRVDLRNAPASTSGLLLVGVSTPTVVLLPSTCTLAVRAPAVLASFAAPVGSWTFDVPIPQAPALAGVAADLQAFVWSSVTPTVSLLSNGVTVAFGR